MAQIPSPKKEVPIEIRIKEVTNRLMEAMLENASASKEETDAKIKKQKSHYKVQQASQELNNLRGELMEVKID